MEHIDVKVSSDSKLQASSICFIRTRSRNLDISGKSTAFENIFEFFVINSEINFIEREYS